MADTYTCSFCSRKKSDNIEIMITANPRSNAVICGDCVDACISLRADFRAGKHLPDAEPGYAHTPWGYIPA